MAELYRIKRGKSAGAVSTGDWSYFESRDSAFEALMEWHFENVYSHSRGFRARFLSLWLGRVYSHSRWLTTQIFSFEQFVNDEWVPLEYRFTNPSLIVTYPTGRTLDYEINLAKPMR